MTFGSFQQRGKEAPFADINITPMVDVMLVLLVIFIITAPLFNHQIALNLPHAEADAAPQSADTINLSIDTHGRLFWNNQVLPATDLLPKLSAAAKKMPQPALQIRADNETRYEEIVKVMAAAQRAGLSKLGFVTEPKDESGNLPAQKAPPSPQKSRNH